MCECLCVYVGIMYVGIMYVYIYIYSVSQKERPIFLEVTLSVHLSNKLYLYLCPIPNGFQDTTISLYRGLDVAPSSVLTSRRTAPLYETCESV